MKMRAVIVLCCFVFASLAEARVFRMKEQTAGTYIQGTAGNSLLGNSVFNRYDVNIENKVSYNAGGEFGLMFLASRTWIRVGVEIIRPHLIEGAQAKDTVSEQVYYRVNSSVLSWGPVVNLEFPLRVFESVRLFFTGGLGYMKTTVKNDYVMTSLGNTTYGVSDYTEEASAYSFMSQGGLGVEFALADSSTFVLSGGYRGLIASNLKHERSNATIDGNVNAGDSFRDGSGDRVINLSGYWVGLGLRFYWNF